MIKLDEIDTNISLFKLSGLFEIKNSSMAKNILFEQLNGCLIFCPDTYTNTIIVFTNAK